MLFAPALAPAQQPKPASAAGLRIVVIAGEDAVNIIQQKTAVNPIVEVRDRNNLPVSGVAVTFSVGGQGATFGGASALTVTTNAAGQAVVTGLTPTATGAITINATATVQGQAIAATITQTNFATAAEAAQAAASTGGAGSGGASGSGGGGTSGAAGGGGISGATLGIVGGAIAGVGAIAAAASGGGGDSAPATTSTPPPAAPTATTFNGPVSGTTTFTWTTSEGGQVFLTCTATYARNGTLRMILTTQSNGTVTGTAQMLSFTTRVTSTVCSGGLQVPIPNVITDNASGSIVPVTGTTGSLRFSEDFSLSDSQQGFTTVVRGTSTFTGSLSGGVITGTLAETFTMTSDGLGLSIRGNWSSSFPVTLR